MPPTGRLLCLPSTQRFLVFSVFVYWPSLPFPRPLTDCPSSCSFRSPARCAIFLRWFFPVASAPIRSIFCRPPVSRTLNSFLSDRLSTFTPAFLSEPPPRCCFARRPISPLTLPLTRSLSQGRCSEFLFFLDDSWPVSCKATLDPNAPVSCILTSLMGSILPPSQRRRLFRRPL